MNPCHSIAGLDNRADIRRHDRRAEAFDLLSQDGGDFVCAYCHPAYLYFPCFRARLNARPPVLA
jgi:hypothetical protein